MLQLLASRPSVLLLGFGVAEPPILKLLAEKVASSWAMLSLRGLD